MHLQNIKLAVFFSYDVVYRPLSKSDCDQCISTIDQTANNFSDHSAVALS